MDPKSLPARKYQSVLTEKFLFYFLGLRKGEIRRNVATLQAHHPDEGPEQLASRLIVPQAPLSFFGGVLLDLPLFLPGVSNALRIVGVAGGTAIMMQMHVSLIREIALLFGRDIDDHARVKEMLAVLALSGLASSSPFLVRKMKPWYALPVTGVAVSTMGALIGETAIRYYSRGYKESGAEPASSAVGAASEGRQSVS